MLPPSSSAAVVPAARLAALDLEPQQFLYFCRRAAKQQAKRGPGARVCGQDSEGVAGWHGSQSRLLRD